MDSRSIKNVRNPSTALNTKNHEKRSENGKLLEDAKGSPNSSENSVVLVEMPSSRDKSSPGSSSDTGDIEFLEIIPNDQMVIKLKYLN